MPQGVRLSKELEQLRCPSLCSLNASLYKVADPRSNCSLARGNVRRGWPIFDWHTQLLILIVDALAARPNLLALGQRVRVRAPLHRGDCFEFLRRVVPLAFDRCSFIEIKLFGVV